MPEYRLRGARRGDDGSIGEMLLDEPLVAESRAAAIKAANQRDWSEDDESVNALWLFDEQGALIWSLRLADTNR